MVGLLWRRHWGLSDVLWSLQQTEPWLSQTWACLSNFPRFRPCHRHTVEIGCLLCSCTLCRLWLDDQAVRVVVAVGIRLGLAICVSHHCRCGSLVDAFGLHSFVRRKALANSADTTHWMIWLHALSPLPVTWVPRNHTVWCGRMVLRPNINKLYSHSRYSKTRQSRITTRKEYMLPTQKHKQQSTRTHTHTHSSNQHTIIR